MSIQFRAEDEPVRSRVERLRHVIGDSVVPLEYEPRVDASRVTDRLLVKDLALVRVVALTGTAARVRRSPRLISRSDPGLCKIDVVVHGEVCIAQGARQARLGPGDFTFVDLSRPCTWRVESTSTAVALMFPRSSLPVPPDDLGELCGLRMSGDEGVGALVSSLARALPDSVDDDVAGDVRLGTAVTDLVSAALATRIGRDSALPRDTAQRALLLRIQAFIEQRLGDIELTPATVAAAHHISVRYLYKLFAARGVPVGEWIRRRRLDRCRRDLLDPSMSNRPVSAIAARWGLTNASHFNRLFRTAYDLPPGEFRLHHVHGRRN